MARILIAEDQEDLREMIAYALRLEGHQVLAAADGEDALEQAEESLPDLFILDIAMPRMSGYQLCRQLKEQTRFKDAPVIIISAKGHQDEIMAGLEAGAEVYIRKPFEPETLMSRVKSLLTPV